MENLAVLDWTGPSPEKRFEVTLHGQGKPSFTWAGPALDEAQALVQAKADIRTAWHVAVRLNGSEAGMPDLNGEPEFNEDTGTEDYLVLEPAFHAALAGAGGGTRHPPPCHDERALASIAQAALEAAACNAALPQCTTLTALYGQAYDGPWNKVALLTPEISYFGSEAFGEQIQGGLPRTDSLRATLVALTVLHHLGLKEFGVIPGEITGMTSTSVKAAIKIRLRDRLQDNVEAVCRFLAGLGLSEATSSFRKDFGP